MQGNKLKAEVEKPVENSSAHVEKANASPKNSVSSSLKSATKLSLVA
jgi:hypothetical protein